jgi:glycosyltransferase involved in cell wall biosynthesis
MLVYEACSRELIRGVSKATMKEIKMKKISIIIPTYSNCKVRTDLRGCLFDHEVIVERATGIGLARNLGVLKSKGDIIVMLDSDLNVKPELWHWLVKLRRGTLAMVKNCKHQSYSSRVFAIHREDYLKIGGFNSSLKYLWEDGEFALRASEKGFKIAPVPLTMYEHLEHEPRCLKSQFFIPFNWEYARLFVKFNRKIYPRVERWFLDQANLKKGRLNAAPILVRLAGFFFWNLKSIVGDT